MTLRHALAFTLLATASTAGFADTFTAPIDLSSGNAGFGRNNAIGSFVDSYTFTLAGSSFFTSSVSTSASGNQILDFTSVQLRNAANAVLFTYAGNLGTATNKFYALSEITLAAGAYQIVLMGTNSATQASYSGTAAITPVPEPTTGALALAGIGVIGFLVRRRRPA